MSSYIESDGGIYEVELDGVKVYSNDGNRGHIPDDHEVIELLSKAGLKNI